MSKCDLFPMYYNSISHINECHVTKQVSNRLVYIFFHSIKYNYVPKSNHESQRKMIYRTRSAKVDYFWPHVMNSVYTSWNIRILLNILDQSSSSKQKRLTKCCTEVRSGGQGDFVKRSEKQLFDNFTKLNIFTYPTCIKFRISYFKIMVNFKI